MFREEDNAGPTGCTQHYEGNCRQVQCRQFGPLVVVVMLGSENCNQYGDEVQDGNVGSYSHQQRKFRVIIYCAIISKITSYTFIWLPRKFMCAKLVRVTGLCHGYGRDFSTDQFADLQSQLTPTKTIG